MTGGVRWVGEGECDGPSEETFGRQRRQDLPRVVRKVDNAIHWINHHPEESVVCFTNT